MPSPTFASRFVSALAHLLRPRPPHPPSASATHHSSLRTHHFPPIRLVALDLDGTLLDSDKRVSGRTVRALRLLPRLGVKTVLASARPPRSCKAIYDGLGLDTWQINYNGALVWDPLTRRSVHHWPMPGTLTADLIRAARAACPGVQIAAEILDCWYTDRHDPYRTSVTGRRFRPDVVAPVSQWCDRPVTKLMFLAEPRKIARVRETLRRFAADAKAVHADPDLVQVTSAHAGKDVALRVVADHYGVEMSQTLAVGDALNDVDLLWAAGVAVAVANGCRQAKAVADWVAPANDDHGVYHALLRYLPLAALLAGPNAHGTLADDKSRSLVQKPSARPRPALAFSA